MSVPNGFFFRGPILHLVKKVRAISTATLLVVCKGLSFWIVLKFASRHLYGGQDSTKFNFWKEGERKRGQAAEKKSGSRGSLVKDRMVKVEARNMEGNYESEVAIYE